MRHYEYFIKLVLMWHAMKIIGTHGELLSKENLFSIQKYPAATTTTDAESIKNIPKICYEHKAHNQIAYNNSNNNNDTNDILNIFKNILKYFHQIDCTENEKRNLNVWNLSAEHRQLESDVEEADIEEDEEELMVGAGDQYEMQQFNILQQLKLDEQKQKWQEQHKTQQQQQQNALKLQQLGELQQIMQHFESQALGKAGKKKKKKKKKKKRKKKKKKPKDKEKKRKKKPIVQPLLTQPAHILYASPTQKPYHHYHYPHKKPATTKKPFYQHELVPLKKIKYILRKNTIFKKKKKEYLNHLKHVIYPFVKFIAFFTILNPFTLAVFLFSLISPVVFGFLGFIALSFLIKPALHLLFGVKHTVSSIKRKKWLEQRKRQRLRDSRRPITIHKHYYQQRPIAPPSHTKRPHHHHQHQHHPPPPPPPKIVHHFPHHQPLLEASSAHTHQHYPRNRHTHGNQRPGQVKWFNPLLPHEKEKLKKDTHFLNDFEDYKETYN